MLIKTFLAKVDVNVSRDSSFREIKSDASTGHHTVFDLDTPSRRPQSQGAAANVPRYNNLSTEEILKKLFQLLINPLKDFLNGNKLIVVPDRHLFFVPFSALLNENGNFLSSSYSIQITPALHTLKTSMKRGHDSNTAGFALFVGNPIVGEVSLNGKEFSPSALPGAGREVEYIANLFHATPLLGRKARKQVECNFLVKLALSMHIAAHGEPTRGEIMLAPNTINDSPCLSVPKIIPSHTEGYYKYFSAS